MMRTFFSDSTGRAFLKGSAAVPGEVAEAMNMQSRAVAPPGFQSCASCVEARTRGRGPVRKGLAVPVLSQGSRVASALFSSAARLSPACLQRVAEPAHLGSPVPPGYPLSLPISNVRSGHGVCATARCLRAPPDGVLVADPSRGPRFSVTCMPTFLHSSRFTCAPVCTRTGEST